MAKKKNKALLKIYFLSAILFLILFLPSILLNIYFNTSTGRANLETALKKYGIAVDFKYCLTLFPVITKIENGIIKYKDSKIKFKSISVKLKLLSLLKGNIEITKLGLDNLAVHFMGKKISKINGMISLPFKRIPKFNLHGYIQNQTGKPGVSISASNQKKESIITLKMSNTAEEFDSIFATSIYQTIVKKYSIKLRKKMNIKATIDIDKLSQPEFKIFVPDLEFKENRFKNTSIYIVKKRNKYKFQISSAAINGNLIFDKHMKFEAGNFKLQMDTLYGKLNSDLTISNKKHGISFKAKNLQFRSPLGFTVLSRKISTLFTSDNHIKDLVIQKTALYIKGYKKPLIFKYNKFDINKKNLSGTGLLIFPEQQNKIIRKISIYSLFKRIIDLPFKYSVVYDGKIISVSSEDKNIELYFTPSSSSLTFRIRKQISSKGIVENLLDLSNQNQVKVTKFFEDGTLKFDITGLVSNWKLKNVTVNHILFTKKEKKISFELTDCNITELLKNDSKNHIQMKICTNSFLQLIKNADNVIIKANISKKDMISFFPGIKPGSLGFEAIYSVTQKKLTLTHLKMNGFKILLPGNLLFDSKIISLIDKKKSSLYGNVNKLYHSQDDGLNLSIDKIKGHYKYYPAFITGNKTDIDIMQLIDDFPIDLDVNLEIDKLKLYHGKEFSADITGRIKCTKNKYSTIMNINLTVDNGFLIYKDERYSIDNLVLILNGGTYSISPLVFAEISVMKNAYRIVFKLNGDVNGNFELYSEPHLERKKILSLLSEMELGILNQISNPAQAFTLFNAGLGLGKRLFATKLENKISDALNLSEFSVLDDFNDGLSLKLSKEFSERLSLSYKQPLSRSEDNHSTYSVQYLIKPNVILDYLQSDDENSLKLKYSIKY